MLEGAVVGGEKWWNGEVVKERERLWEGWDGEMMHGVTHWKNDED